MSAPHFCNFCKNHGVPTRFTYAHKFSCPWSECACELCNRLRQRNHYRRTLATSRRNAATSATCTATTATGGASAFPMVANGTKTTGATSSAAARAGKVLFSFCFRWLKSYRGCIDKKDRIKAFCYCVQEFSSTFPARFWYTQVLMKKRNHLRPMPVYEQLKNFSQTRWFFLGGGRGAALVNIIVLGLRHFHFCLKKCSLW